MSKYEQRIEAIRNAPDKVTAKMRPEERYCVGMKYYLEQKGLSFEKAEHETAKYLVKIYGGREAAEILGNASPTCQTVDDGKSIVDKVRAEIRTNKIMNFPDKTEPKNKAEEFMSLTKGFVNKGYNMEEAEFKAGKEIMSKGIIENDNFIDNTLEHILSDYSPTCAVKGKSYERVRDIEKAVKAEMLEGTLVKPHMGLPIKEKFSVLTASAWEKGHDLQTAQFSAVKELSKEYSREEIVNCLSEVSPDCVDKQSDKFFDKAMAADIPIRSTIEKTSEKTAVSCLKPEDIAKDIGSLVNDFKKLNMGNCTRKSYDELVDKTKTVLSDMKSRSGFDKSFCDSVDKFDRAFSDLRISFLAKKEKNPDILKNANEALKEVKESAKDFCNRDFSKRINKENTVRENRINSSNGIVGIDASLSDRLVASAKHNISKGMGMDEAVVVASCDLLRNGRCSETALENALFKIAPNCLKREDAARTVAAAKRIVDRSAEKTTNNFQKQNSNIKENRSKTKDSQGMEI